MPGPLHVEVEVAPAYEFVLSLAAAADVAGQHTYEIQPEWFLNLSQSASQLVSAVRDFSPTDMVWAHLLSFAYDTPPPRGVAAFIDHVARADAVELRLRLLGYYVRHIRRHTLPEVIARAARGEREAQREFIRTSHTDDEAWQAALERILPLEPQQTKAALLPLLQAWSARVFPDLRTQALPSIERDAERVREVLRSSGGEAAIEAALPGVDFVPDHGVGAVVLIPSYVIRPQIYTFDHLNLRLYAYPVADASLAVAGDLPPLRLVRLLKALGDERRLRVLRLLAQGSFTLQELADYFDVGNTTMLHHMVILRSAGLVRVRTDRGKRYSLVRASLPQVGGLLEAYLGGDVAGKDEGAGG